MRTLTLLVGLPLFALAATAGAPATALAADTEASPATAPAASPAEGPSAAAVAPPAGDTAGAAESRTGSRRKLQIGLSFLPMAQGKYTYSDTDISTATLDSYLAYGIGVSAGYEVLPGLIVGLAPQVLFNVQPKPTDTVHPAVAKEFDLMARVAYEVRPVEEIAVYAEVLPGYSRVSPSDETSPGDGLVLAFGVGCAADLTDRYFLTLGGGYQMGFQNQTAGVHTRELRTKYVRVAMGGGIRF